MSGQSACVLEVEKGFKVFIYFTNSVVDCWVIITYFLLFARELKELVNHIVWSYWLFFFEK